MESIVEIMKKWPELMNIKEPQALKGSRWQQHQNRAITDEESEVIMSNSEAAKKLWWNSPPDEKCPYCSADIIFKGIKDKSSWVYEWIPEPCSCPEAQQEYKHKQEREAAARAILNFKESGMSRRHVLNTFESFRETPNNREAKQIAQKYVEDFHELLPKDASDPGRNGLFITGGVGVGKTHLVSAIANALLAKGYRVICMTMIDLLDRIKKAYDYGEISEGEVLELYETVDLLIIDDLGKERVTEWGSSKIYTIINGRYERLMPTIVTTNYGDDELVSKLTPPNGDRITAEATIDRLCEMCKGIVMSGDSWRSNK